MNYKKLSDICFFIGVLLLAVGIISGLLIILFSSEATSALNIPLGISAGVGGAVAFASFYFLSAIFEGIAEIKEQIKEQSDNINQKITLLAQILDSQHK